MGSKFSRKIKRNKMKKKKAQLQLEIKNKLKHFEKLPECCLMCEKPFDKKNKEMVINWYVIVRKTQETVNLYCPTCWQRALDNVKKIEERLNEI